MFLTFYVSNEGLFEEFHGRGIGTQRPAVFLGGCWSDGGNVAGVRKTREEAPRGLGFGL